MMQPSEELTAEEPFPTTVVSPAQLRHASHAQLWPFVSVRSALGLPAGSLTVAPPRLSALRPALEIWPTPVDPVDSVWDTNMYRRGGPTQSVAVKTLSGAELGLSHTGAFTC